LTHIYENYVLAIAFCNSIITFTRHSLQGLLA